ncbi:MAG: CPBP family intramembrane glutamic endopeptidase [Pseudomonadota bacterium]
MPPNSDHPDADTDPFPVLLAGTIFLGVLAAGIAALFDIPLQEGIRIDLNDICIGVIATAPLGLALYWLERTNIPYFALFREKQLNFFSELGVAFTPARIVILSVGAGVCEELLFRGVVQGGLTSVATLPLAIILASLLFGLLHFSSLLFAVIATAIGIYLGVLYAITDNLITPMITHGLYDALAFCYIARALARKTKR